MKLFDKHDPLHGLRAFLVLDAAVRLALWSSAMALSLALLTRMRAWPGVSLIAPNSDAAWAWAGFAVKLVLTYNTIYVLLLLLARLPIPRPKPGRYTAKPGHPLDKNLIYSCLIATLTKARYEAPFPAFLVFHIFNLPPIAWLSGRIFGPRTRSCYVVDPQIVDPHLTTLGRNVVIGFGCIIGAHHQEQDHVVIGETIIEDDVLVGAGTLMSCVHIKKGASIGAASLLLPGTVVGEGEYWSGNPARRRGTRKQVEAMEGQPEEKAPLESTPV